LNSSRRTAVAVAGVVIAVLLVAAVPLYPYSSSFSMFRSSEATPVDVPAYSTLLYRLTGFGAGPYPQVMLVKQGNASAVVHFQGATISYWEGPFPPDLSLNPSGVVRIANASISQWAFGLLNFTATLDNVGSRTISNLTVIFHYPSYGKNESFGGLVRSVAPSATCSSSLAPSESCTATVTLPQSASLLTDEEYPMMVEAWSPGPPAGSSNGASPFLSVDNLRLRYPGAGLSPQWVQTFIQSVNKVRNSTSLIENKTLDEFAAFRYDSIRSEFQISDFNFTGDFQRFFGTSGPTLFEEILYPAGQDPASYPSFLHKYAPGHWAGLMNSVFKEYGYFFGTGPAVEVGPGCSATEVPGPNMNITQYVISHGCSYVIADEIWFILILGV